MPIPVFFIISDQNNNSGEQQLQHLLEDEHLRCLDAFLLVLDANADVIFASSGVTDVLGLNQVRLKQFSDNFNFPVFCVSLTSRFVTHISDVLTIS